MEPSHFMPSIYKIIKIYENEYDLIFTYDEELLKRNPDKYVFATADMPIIEEQNCKIHEKTKLVSMIYSNKRFLKNKCRLNFTQTSSKH